MRTKVLYTNGDRIAELFWVQHTGTDVYCGQPNSSSKKSYHASGKLHEKVDGIETNSHWVAPLKEIKGQFHLMTIGIRNPRQWSEGAFKNIEYSNSKLDNAIFIDSRSIPEKEEINIVIGLLEPNNYGVLNSISQSIPNIKLINLATHETPWVYTLLIWPPYFPESA